MKNRTLKISAALAAAFLIGAVIPKLYDHCLNVPPTELYKYNVAIAKLFPSDKTTNVIGSGALLGKNRVCRPPT